MMDDADVQRHTRVTEAALTLTALPGLGSSEELFRALSSHTPVGVFVSNADGKCLYVNGRWCELAGIPAERALGDGWAAALHPEDAERVLGEWTEAGAAGRDSIVEYRFLRPDGGVSWIQGFASALHADDGRVVGWVGTCLDQTERVHAEERLQELADHDPLTGLLNRRRFNEELARESARIRRHGGRAAVLIVDLDCFKSVNDSLGHRAGDELLCAVARALESRIRVSDVLARLGGDEFAVVAPGCDDETEARALASDLAEAIRSLTVVTSGTAVRITASVGVALLAETAAANWDDLLVTADRAMYRAKQRGRDQVVYSAA